MAAPLKAVAKICRSEFYPRCIQVRHGHKFNPKSNRPKPLERRIFEAVTQPIYPELEVHPAEICGRKKEQELKLETEENAYEEFLKKQMKTMFDDSQMIIVCQRLPFSNVRMRNIRVEMQKEGMKMSICNNKHALEVIKDTKLEKMAPYFIGMNLLVMSTEPKPQQLMKITRKTPELVVLGGFLQDRLVSKNDIQEIINLPPLEQLYGELAGCLNLIGGGRTLSLLNSHLNRLCVNLDQYVKQSQERDKT